MRATERRKERKNKDKRHERDRVKETDSSLRKTEI